MINTTYLKNVATLELDKSKCTGCRMCIEVCPHAVYNIIDKKSSIINKDKCMECGACAKNCPEDAINVKAGVGCAMAIIIGWMKGTEPTCGCSCDDNTGSAPSCC